MTMKHCCAIGSSSDWCMSDENIHTLRCAKIPFRLADYTLANIQQPPHFQRIELIL